MSTREIVDAMVDEYEVARAKFPAFHSAHEGFAVIKEEVDELWDLVRKDGDGENMEEEAVQIGAMAIAFIVEVCGSKRDMPDVR